MIEKKMLSIMLLRKYATYLLTTSLSNVIFQNVMTRLILTITKQVFDNHCIQFNIKTWTVLNRMQVFNGTIFCCVRSCRREATIFHIRCFSCSTSYFSSEKDPGTVKFYTYKWSNYRIKLRNACTRVYNYSYNTTLEKRRHWV